MYVKYVVPSRDVLAYHKYDILPRTHAQGLLG